MQIYTFDFICECQDFNHNEEFVLKEDLDSEMESKQKEIQSIKKMIVEARSIYFEGLEDGSLWVKINANNPIVKDWLEKTSNIKVD